MTLRNSAHIIGDNAQVGPRSHIKGVVSLLGTTFADRKKLGLVRPVLGKRNHLEVKD